MEGFEIIHDSHEIKFRNPFGAVKIGTKVIIKLWTNKECIAYINLINFYNNQIEVQMKKSNEVIREYGFTYDVEVDTSNSLGLVYYFFRVNINGYDIIYGNNVESLGGRGHEYYNEPKSYQITVYKDYKVPNWYKEGVIYQIFVDRFFNGNECGVISNPKKNCFIYGKWEDEPMYIRDWQGNIARWDFYGGNLLGVKKKLEYIKSLGVSVIYFNPIFESVSCHKYDTGDYEKVDPMFGTEEAFSELCSLAEEMGIKIILDGVFSHTGSDSKYFNKLGNYKNVGAYQSLQSEYYRWYCFNDYPNYYQSWWGFENMPNVDELNPSYLDYIIRNKNSIIEKWLKLGASGWRLDVADELPDEFIKLLKKKLLETKNDGVLVGEVWDDASNKVSYSKKREYLFGNELDSVTNYPLRQIIIDLVKRYINSEYFIKKYISLMENYPKEYFYSTMNMLGNHDTERILTLVDNNIDLLKMAVIIQMTLPGVPLIYYGDEAGLTGGKDPENRKAYPWERENNNILEFYKNICNVRVSEIALKEGEIIFRNYNNNVLCYERVYKEERIVVLINPSNKDVLYSIDNINGALNSLIISEEHYNSANQIIEINLKSNECKVLKLI